jgi:hypothetical protein
LTFAKHISKRRQFQCNIAGLPLSFVFDKDICELADADGVSKADGSIWLNPSLSDNMMLDTACHEVVEVAKARLEWDITHQQVQQLGFLVGAMLEWTSS